MESSRSSLRFRLADVLRDRIVDGDLSPGDRLPSEPDLARVLGVSRASVRAAITVLEEDGFVRVDIGDQGPGIPPEIRSRIFEPFFTTKPIGQGTGMGLDIAFRIVAEGHHGTLTFESEPGRTVFTVCLPAVAS